MTTEEKARRYDEALERAKRMFSEKELNYLFPRLQESEDERIRKAIYIYLDWLDGRNKNYQPKGDYSIRDMIAWLEKQGEKPKKVSIWKHWKDGIAGGAEGEQIFLTKIGSIYSISSCLGCECDYIELSELDKLMRDEKQGKLKWSEEDEHRAKDTIYFLDTAKKHYASIVELDACINWLKTIKKRMEE